MWMDGRGRKVVTWVWVDCFFRGGNSIKNEGDLSVGTSSAVFSSCDYVLPCFEVIYFSARKAASDFDSQVDAQ